MITIEVTFDLHSGWFRADCKQVAGNPPVGIGLSIEAAVCALLGEPSIRDRLMQKAKNIHG